MSNSNSRRRPHTTIAAIRPPEAARMLGALLTGSACATGAAYAADEPPQNPPDTSTPPDDALRLAQARTESDATSSSTATDASQIQEVVVRGVVPRFRPDDQTTATGLNMKLVDTPQAITVLSNELLDIAGAQSAYEATDLVPGLVRAGSGFGLDRYTLRGNVVSTLRINGIQTNIFNSVDGLAVDRIEVVRGPATVLYGVTGSFGGEINHVLKSPQREYHSDIELKAGEYELKQGDFDITGPLSESMSGRLVAGYRDWSVAVDVPNINNHE
ncbi:MAG TPA: TonB-dependent receptor plug domain-containing protein, partial [Povalibacter sp.]|nr:TonB-dependent receptor plug domain-containing protein [Povalibacter sp.]